MLWKYLEGELYDENIITVFYLIMDKVLTVLRKNFEMQNKMDPNVTLGAQPYRILYLNTNFARKMSSPNQD
jgi:hypothetical protein